MGFPLDRPTSTSNTSSTQPSAQQTNSPQPNTNSTTPPSNYFSQMLNMMANNTLVFKKNFINFFIFINLFL